MNEFRIEKDSLGEVKVPRDAWYGAQTARAVANFPISGRRPDNDFVLAHVRIKLAAARANCQPGWLPEEKRDAIVAACEKIIAGEHADQFVVDRFQAGAGTSHNMNSNEVIANLASVALGGEKGSVQAGQPQRRRQHGAVDQRHHPHRDPPGRAGQAAAPDRGGARHGRGIQPPGRAREGHGEVRPHPSAGCGADHAGTGIRRLRVDAFPLRRGARRGAPGAVRNRAGRLRRRHRAQHLARLPGARRRRTGHAHRRADPRRPAGRADAVDERPRAAVGRNPQPCAGTHPHLQRPAPARFRPAHRPRRNPAAAGAAGVFHHARQGQSGDVRDAEPGVLPGAGAGRRRVATWCRPGRWNST